MAYANSDKAEFIAHSFRNQCTLNHDVVNPRMVVIVNSKVEEFLHTNNENTLHPTNHPEVVTYIENLKKNKALGFDCISTNILIYLPLNYTFFLTFLINIMINLHMYSDCCKKALIVPIQKPRQDRHAPSSFRPIYLLS